MLAGGTKPQVKFEHEKIVKVPDPEAQPQPNWRDDVMRDDEILELVELEHGLDPNQFTPAQAKNLYPGDWKKYERQLREQQVPLRKS